MNTITIDSATYQGAKLYARLHNISIEAAFEKGVSLLLGTVQTDQSRKTTSGYYISPKVKALETGFKCPENLSSDYKEEILDALTEKYL